MDNELPTTAMVLDDNDDDDNDDTVQKTQQDKSQVTNEFHLPSGTKRPSVNGRAIRQEKQRRWAIKQERLRQLQLPPPPAAAAITATPNDSTTSQLNSEHANVEEDGLHAEQLSWIQNNSHFCKLLTHNDVEHVKSIHKNNKNNNNESCNTDWEELLRPYLNLKDGQQQKNLTKDCLFIAEGAETVRLLIRQALVKEKDLQDWNKIQVVSIFCKCFAFFHGSSPLQHELVALLEQEDTTKTQDQVMDDDNNTDANATTRTGQQQQQQQPPFYIFLGSSEAILSAVAGFPITRGAMACGMVPTRDEAWLLSYLEHRIRRDRWCWCYGCRRRRRVGKSMLQGGIVPSSPPIGP